MTAGVEGRDVNPLTGLEGLFASRQHAQGQSPGWRQAFQRQHVLAFLPAVQSTSTQIKARLKRQRV